MQIETNLEGLLEALTHAVEDATAATRVTNAILLADSRLSVDIREPLEAAKVMRYLDSVEKYVASDEA